MTKNREKAIKLYWGIAKGRCPFHEEEIVNGFLEGFIDCAEYLLQQYTELEKENAELKADNAEWEKASDKWKSVYELTNNQLTKAKDIIKFAIKGIKKIACEERCDFVNKEFFCDDCAYGKWIAKAEQFLKE